jgi:hypothetical protein
MKPQNLPTRFLKGLTATNVTEATLQAMASLILSESVPSEGE